jgi:hypothetical protein
MTIEEHRAERARNAERIATKAAQIWGLLDDNAKTGIRFGMFPFDVMKAAEADGFKGSDATALCVALMDCARRNGGMRA